MEGIIQWDLKYPSQLFQNTSIETSPKIIELIQINKPLDRRFIMDYDLLGILLMTFRYIYWLNTFVMTFLWQLFCFVRSRKFPNGQSETRG